MRLKVLQNLLLEQPNLQVHVIKFWPSLKQLDAIQKPIFLVKHYENTRTAFHRQCFRKQPANNSKVRSRFSLLLPKEQKIANVSTEHLRIVGRNLKNISKVQIQHFSIFVYQFGLQRL